jgi:hypothetical protein
MKTASKIIAYLLLAGVTPTVHAAALLKVEAAAAAAQTQPAEQKRLYCIASPDKKSCAVNASWYENNQILRYGTQATVDLFDIDTQKILKTYDAASRVTNLIDCPYTSGAFFSYNTRDNLCKIWFPNDNDYVIIPDLTGPLSYNHELNTILGKSAKEGTWRLHSLESGKVIGQLSKLETEHGLILVAALSPLKPLLATVHATHDKDNFSINIFVFDVAQKAFTLKETITCTNPNGKFTSLAFSPHNQYLALSGYTGHNIAMTTLLNLTNDNELHTFEGSSSQFNAQETLMATRLTPHCMALYSLQSEQIIRKFKIHPSVQSPIVFTKDYVLHKPDKKSHYDIYRIENYSRLPLALPARTPTPSLAQLKAKIAATRDCRKRVLLQATIRAQFGGERKQEKEAAKQ